MKIQPFSDLHVDFKDYNLNYPVADAADIVVYAGDIGENIACNFDWMAEQLDGKQAIYILGNHEHYQKSYEDTIDKARKQAELHSNIHFLQNDCVKVNGIKFVGSTLWTDFNDSNPMDMMVANQMMNDFLCIGMKFNGGYSRKPFKAQDSTLEYKLAVEYIQNRLSTYKDNSKTVVVTHHAPSARSVDKKFKSSGLNRAYYSDLDYLIEEYTPALWIHGHMHDAKDYNIGDTQVICNPGGYPGYETGRNGFKDMLVDI